MPKENRAKSPKKSFPWGLVAILAMITLAAYWTSSMQTPATSDIGFSYQLEHLANLELLRREDSRKIGSGDGLVSFSGRFKKERSVVSEQRYQYLELLQQRHSLGTEQREILERLKTTKDKIVNAADYYLHLSALPLPPQGYEINIGDADAVDAFPNIAINKLSHRRLIDAPLFKERLGKFVAHAQPSSEQIAEFKKFTRDYLLQFQSMHLGLCGKAEAQVKWCQQKLDKDTGNIVRFHSTLNTIDRTLREILDELNEWRGVGRLAQTRSAREYEQLWRDYGMIHHRLIKADLQLDKSRQTLKEATWFFNDKELSTRGLETQDVEVYSQWFIGARALWDRFESNKNSEFKVPDQPRNAVLDRTFKSEELPTNYTGMLLAALPILTVIVLLYLAYSKQIRGMGSNALSFGKSPAKLLQRGTHKVTFQDVAGIEEAKEELQEIVEFLKDPQRFTSLGAQIPKGILCVGPPGTGKTLIAKAVAGEADRPFFSISGSDFVEMFVGVGASRIRDMFEQARKNAPCIIFMDEIDAVGRHRGAGMGGGHDEREQTLNQLLVEMDGFDSNEGIILMAATNRPDVLDKALLRPGRFDRQVVIDLPDIKGRFEILKLHARKVKLGDSVDLMKIARATSGCSGADLKNILNEAALLAVKRGQPFVTTPEISEACDKVRFGKERKSLEITEQEKRSTAFHEAGHVIVGLVLKRCDPVEKVTVIPRGMSLGATYMLPTKNRLGYWREELYELMAMLMGGRCAEERFVKDISSGAKNDIERATELARSMVCEWGMSDRVGLVALDDREESRSYLTGMPSGSRQHSPQTAQAIDEEVRKLCTASHEKARQIVDEHAETVQYMADALFELETLDAKDLHQILEGNFDIEAKRRQLLDEAKSSNNEPTNKTKKTKDKTPKQPLDLKGELGTKNP